MQTIEQEISLLLNLPEIKCGTQIIRNENGWRENEKVIDYMWIVYVQESFNNWWGICSVKFQKNQFRKYNNPDELVQILFLYTNKITHYYINRSNNFDPIINHTCLNIFETGKNTTLDGVSYSYLIKAANSNALIHINNPMNENWKKWETEIINLGKKLSLKSDYPEIKNIFENS